MKNPFTASLVHFGFITLLFISTLSAVEKEIKDQKKQPAVIPELISGEMKPYTFHQIIKDKCISCHGTPGKKIKGDFDLARLLKSTDSNPELWLEAYQQVKKGEMPPEDEPALEEREKEILLASMKQMAEDSTTAVTTRILTPIEIKNTVVDLLGINEAEYNPFETLNNSYSHKTYYTMQKNMLTPYYLQQLYHVLNDSLESFVFTKPQLEKLDLKVRFPNQVHRVYGFQGNIDLRWPRNDMYNSINFLRPGEGTGKKWRRDKRNKDQKTSSIGATLNKLSLPPGIYKLKFTAQSLNLDLSKLDKKIYGPALRKRYQ